MIKNKISGSFRDPSGFLFKSENELYRQVNYAYKDDYDHLMNSGLYKELEEKGLLISHLESGINPADSNAYKVLKPKVVPFISYPYEWSFSEIKDAALLTLQIQKIALNHGMSLKDCSAYNVQFLSGKPVFIDTLSFEKYKEGKPWVAYKQFCQHFLAPLALMSLKDIRFNCLLRDYIDGIPLDLASMLIGKGTYLNFSLLIHIHLHAKSQKHYEDKQDVKLSKINTFSKNSFLGLVDSLENTVKSLKLKSQKTEWGDYYNFTNYSDEAFEHKKEIIEGFLKEINPKTLWDLGANTGVFSRIASQKGINTISFDIDHTAVEKNYLRIKKENEANLLPLLLDLTNPTPAIGWANEERMSLNDRGPVDAIQALALIHHLAISNNVPLEKIAQFFSELCNSLILEFVPKSDSQVIKLLSTREDIFNDYNEEALERDFSKYFSLIRKVKINNTERTLYYFERKKQG